MDIIDIILEVSLVTWVPQFTSFNTEMVLSILDDFGVPKPIRNLQIEDDHRLWLLKMAQSLNSEFSHEKWWFSIVFC